MTDSLPLIPGKSTKVCTDVKPVLREVFQKLDILPPLATEGRDKSGGSGDAQKDDKWIEQLKTECKEILAREGELKQQYASRLARDPLPNIYKLHEKRRLLELEVKRDRLRSSDVISDDVEERTLGRRRTESIQRHILERKNQPMKIQRCDLMPSIVQNAVGDQTLWIKNILTRSSGELTPVQVRGTRIPEPMRQTNDSYSTLMSMSLGEVAERTVPPPLPVTSTILQSEYIICIPPQLDFVNFTVGHVHTQSIRLVNVSALEVRLSVRPPGRRELDVEISGPRGLLITSGADTEFRIHFRPRDVRVLRDELLVRVSLGKALLVPISCYMQPPMLNILVPSVLSSAFFCTPEGGEATSVARGSDIIELGTRLLGDVHSVQLVFHCDASHVAFFILTEDAWLSFSLEELSVSGSIVAGQFVVSPAWWRGGGEVRARAWCRAALPGLQAAELRVLCTTAVLRPLHLLADSLLYKNDHIIIEAQDRDYDICSEGDDACQYYVHLGTAFPNRALSTTVQLINRSPVTYSFYWSIRPWGICSCWDESSEDLVGSKIISEDLCIGAKYRMQQQREGTLSCEPKEQATRVVVEPARGTVAPRSAVALHVHAPDVGLTLGTSRAVLILVLKDIPKESFPKDFDPSIVRTTTVQSDPIPGLKGWSREVCEVVCAQMEVWWEVAPVRFVIDPAILPIIHSRRVETVQVSLRATQLYGTEWVRGAWSAPAHVALEHDTVLSPSSSHMVDVDYSLPELPNEYPETDVITLKAGNDEWQFSSTAVRSCATRHPALVAPRVSLGVVRPGADMKATVSVLNDTHQHICWWATAYRWAGERMPARVCIGRLPCSDCGERACSCALLHPTRGGINKGEQKDIKYRVVAPDHDGCVATLIQVRRTGADVAHVFGGAGSTARASLVMYRVLGPRLALRAVPCCSATSCICSGSQLLDPGGRGGTATLRPARSLTLHQRTCYRLCITNFTPIPTHVKWDEHLENDVLKVMFMPNEFDVGEYGKIEIKVVLEAVKVTGRRVFVVRASVQHAYRPLYLLIDTAIYGLEIICEIPLGGEEKTKSKMIMKMIQREEYPWEAGKPKLTAPEELFAEFDEHHADTTCRCPYTMQYVPPSPPAPRRPPTSSEDSFIPVEIIWEAPKLSRVCSCFKKKKPTIPDYEEPLCVQFKRLPLYTVRSRTIILRNVSALTARWSAVVRRWPRICKKEFTKDEWARDVSAPGVIVHCRPPSGQLLAQDSLHLQLEVYADCWGLYRDQLLLKVENVQPIVIDVWIEAVGSPLLFALTLPDAEAVPVVWFSSSDPERIVRVKNTSRSALTLYPYIVTEHENPQDELPFRLYLRFYDVPAATCACNTAYQESVTEVNTATTPTPTTTTTTPPPSLAGVSEEVDTMLELYLTADHGIQSDHYFEVSPSSALVSAGAWHEWRVALLVPDHDDLAPHTSLLLRTIPIDNSGPHWYRGPVPPGVARLRHAVRAGCLRLSCREILVQLCALDLPMQDVLRVRKRFQISNLGTLRTVVQASVLDPWVVVADSRRGPCGAGCCRGREGPHEKDHSATLDLMPRSSMEICVEVSVATTTAWPESRGPCGAAGVCRPGRPCGPSGPCALGGPCAPSSYPTRTRSVTKLFFYDTENLLLTLPLVLELEYPAVSVHPPLIDFGFVTDGDTRKTYFTVTHSSRKVTLELVSEWMGPDEFRLWPRYLSVPPGAAERLYVQYTAKWRAAPVEGCARVSARCAAGAWCRGGARARAQPARDLGAAHPPHDHTDDTYLLPPHLPGV